MPEESRPIIRWWHLLYAPLFQGDFFWRNFPSPTGEAKVGRSLVLLFLVTLGSSGPVFLKPETLGEIQQGSALATFGALTMLVAVTGALVFCELIFFFVYLMVFRIANGERLVFSSSIWTAGLVVVASLPEALVFPAITATGGKGFLPLFLPVLTPLVMGLGIQSALRARGRAGIRPAVSALALAVPAVASAALFPFVASMGTAGAVVIAVRAVKLLTEVFHLIP